MPATVAFERSSEDSGPTTSGYSAAFEKGTPIYSGMVAPQRELDGTLYPGGTQQVHVPYSWKHGAITNQWPLR